MFEYAPICPSNHIQTADAEATEIIIIFIFPVSLKAESV